MENSAITYLDDYMSTRGEQKVTSTLVEPVSVDDLFRDHHRAVFKAAMRVTGSSQDAEDVMQTVFLRLLKRSGSELELGDEPARYLCRAAINAGLDILRAKQRNKQVDLQEWQTEPEQQTNLSKTPAIDAEVKQAQLRRMLRKALAEINDRAATIFVLRYFEDYSNGEIAEAMETSTSTIAVTLHRTRDRMQELLREYGVGEQ